MFAQSIKMNVRCGNFCSEAAEAFDQIGKMYRKMAEYKIKVRNVCGGLISTSE